MDRDGRLYVVELKRGHSSQMELQATQYKILIENMKLDLDQAINVHKKFLDKSNRKDLDAKELILDWLQQI